MKIPNNNVTVIGRKVTDFTFSHNIFGENFFSFIIEVDRLSDTKDYLPVIISEKLIDNKYTYDNVCITGQIRSYNQRNEEHTQHLLYLFVREIYPTCEATTNELYLEGFVCKLPIFRETPLGRQITDLMVAVPRTYGKSDYIPCVCWERNAVFASSLEIGTPVKLSGRFQSRVYQKTIKDVIEDRTAYEVSVGKLERGLSCYAGKG